MDMTKLIFAVVAAFMLAGAGSKALAGGCELYVYSGDLEQVTGDGHFEGPVTLTGITNGTERHLTKTWHMLGFTEERDNGVLVAAATGHFESTDGTGLEVTHRGFTLFIPTEEEGVYAGTDHSEVVAARGGYHSGVFVVGLDAGAIGDLIAIQDPDTRASLQWSGGMAQLCRGR